MTETPPSPLPLGEGWGAGTKASASLADIDLTFANGARALSHITLALTPNTITVLVGESGSGKTTLCRVLAGLLAPTTGHAEIDGRPIPPRGKARQHFHRTVQMLLQDAPGSLSPRMTVGALLQEPITIHRLDPASAHARLANLLNRLGLPRTILDRYPHQLSGGQARRVAIARALLLEPTLLIADEPTAGLNLSVQGELLNLLLSLQQDLGLTMLISSHNLGVVRRIAHTTVVMYLGQIVEHGPTAALFAAPAHPYTAALLSAQPAIDPAGRRTRILLHGEIPSVFAPPSGCRFHTRCPQAQPDCRTTEPALEPHGPTTARCLHPL